MKIMSSMSSGELRDKFLDFFKKKKHKIVSSSSLVPTDTSVLFTSAGMQQFKNYYLNERSPYGENVVSVQKCFRTSDIEDVGDESHLSFFEMLGNFSFGSYFKKETIEYAYEFITKELRLKIDYVSIFEGDNAIGKDEESKKIWEKLDSDLKIIEASRKDNFWGPTGEEGPCGPTTEIYIKNAEGKSIEIWNLVFNEYYRDKNGKHEKLKTPGVDTGMGLERLAMIVQGKKNIFETDLFEPIMKAVDNNRIVADHIRASVFLIADGITPSNLGQGYVLRRLLRQSRYRFNSIGAKEKALGLPAKIIINTYKDFYPELYNKKNIIERVISDEEMTFETHIIFAEKLLNKIIINEKYISADNAFLLYATYGLPPELILNIAKENNIEIDINGFNEKRKAHQELSRTASAGMFKSGLVDNSEQVIKYHTATHLLLAALREVLGNDVFQKGSNITNERLRLDFSYPEKMTEEQVKKVEDLVNRKIQENLPVKMEKMNLSDAKKQNAMGVFEQKYEEEVKVYSIGNFSKEICAGPHVENTNMLGKFKILKEESSSAGVRRIKAILE